MRFAFAVLAFVALIAPSAGDGAPLTGTRHDPKSDLWGVYWPVQAVRIGKWQLTDIRVGDRDEFTAYEASRERKPIDAPVAIDFADFARGKTSFEGRAVWAQNHWVPAAAYAIEGTRISFAANDPELGRISFTGTITAALARAQSADHELDDVVLVGMLTVGSQVFNDVRFTWTGYGGD